MLGGINNTLFLTSLSGFVVVAFLALMLRWAFSHNKSLIEAPKIWVHKINTAYLKLLTPKNHIEGEIVRQKLLAVGIKATLTQTKDGPKILVFEKDLKIAKATLDT